MVEIPLSDWRRVIYWNNSKGLCGLFNFPTLNPLFKRGFSVLRYPFHCLYCCVYKCHHQRATYCSYFCNFLISVDWQRGGGLVFVRLTYMHQTWVWKASEEESSMTVSLRSDEERQGVHACVRLSCSDLTWSAPLQKTVLVFTTVCEADSLGGLRWSAMSSMTYDAFFGCVCL